MTLWLTTGQELANSFSELLDAVGEWRRLNAPHPYPTFVVLRAPD